MEVGSFGIGSATKYHESWHFCDFLGHFLRVWDGIMLRQEEMKNGGTPVTTVPFESG